MVKKKTIDLPENISKEDSADLEKIFDKINKLNPDATTLDESSLSNVTDWIDTGSYALNAICSGSLFKGVPGGRVSGFYGPSATGKTLIVNQIMANAQKKGYKIVYFDSESALDTGTAERLGCNLSGIKWVPVEYIEECRNQIISLLTNLIEKNLKKKVLIAIDSLGNLSSMKEANDALEGKNAADMGLRAKTLSSMMRLLTYKAAKAEVPVIFTNHIYESPAEMYPSLVKKQPGGLKHLYISSLLIQLSTTLEKATAENEDTGGLFSKKVIGANLRALTTKNRFVPPYIETNMFLNYKTGLDKYAGLFDLAVSGGMIKQEGPTCSMNGKKLGYASTFANDPNFWTMEVLKQLDELIQNELSFSNKKYENLQNEADIAVKSGTLSTSDKE